MILIILAIMKIIMFRCTVHCLSIKTWDIGTYKSRECHKTKYNEVITEK